MLQTRTMKACFADSSARALCALRLSKHFHLYHDGSRLAAMAVTKTILSPAADWPWGDRSARWAGEAGRPLKHRVPE